MNFETIFINKSELHLLKSVARKKSYEIREDNLRSPEVTTLLYRYKFIEKDVRRTYDDDIYLGTVSVTKTGLDYLEYLQKSKFLFWLKNAWIPITVSLVTTLLTHWLLPLLWRILQ